MTPNPGSGTGGAPVDQNQGGAPVDQNQGGETPVDQNQGSSTGWNTGNLTDQNLTALAGTWEDRWESLDSAIGDFGPLLEEITKAVNSAPVPGSVTQSSSNRLIDGPVSVTWRNQNGLPHFTTRAARGTQNQDGSGTIDSSSTQASVEPGDDFFVIQDRITHSNNPNVIGISGYEQIGGGQAFVTILSNFDPSSPHLDYLSAGFWLFVPNYEYADFGNDFGVFVDGTNPYPQASVAGLTGAATFTGEGGGILVTGNGTVGLYGRTTLTADFGSNSDLGAISGNMDIFNEDGAGTTIQFQPASISNSHSGFFSGTAAWTGNENYGPSTSGNWGGQFYGDTGTPLTVGGTFGLAGTGYAMMGYLTGDGSTEQ